MMKTLIVCLLLWPLCRGQELCESRGGRPGLPCDSILHSSWDSSYVVRWSLRNGGRTLP